jgi:hypothetical protein
MHHSLARRAVLAAALLLLPHRPAGAQPAPVMLSYAGYVHGLNMLKLEASVAMTGQRYRLQLSYTLQGLIGVFVSGEGTSTVDGHFRGNTPLPQTLLTTSRFRGKPRVTEIVWRNGSPVITQMQPPVEEERDPVPPSQQANTIDSLSAMAALFHRVATTGRCDGALTTFDGRRLSSLQAHTVGEEDLPATSRSSFQGTALRCDFEGQQLAGFMRDADQESLRKPQRGSAWFARLAPGTSPIPVRITFGMRSLGEATVYLTGAS